MQNIHTGVQVLGVQVLGVQVLGVQVWVGLIYANVALDSD